MTDTAPTRIGNFTREEEKRIIALWLQDMSIKDIAADLGRSYTSVQSKATHLDCPARFGGVDLSRYKARDCITCKAVICSEGANHRMCDPCRKAADQTMGFSYSSPASRGGRRPAAKAAT